MDDIVILENDLEKLKHIKDSLECFAKDTMKMKFSKWSITSLSRGVNFLGYRIWAKHKLLRKQSVTRAKRAIKALKSSQDVEKLNRFLVAWTGHASWADTHRLFNSLGIAK